MRIGILALQGAVQPHREKLQALGVQAVLVRSAAELAPCAGLVFPGGESTTMLNLIAHYQLKQPLLAFAKEKPVWGVCAGSILMAEKVENPPQESFGLLPITVRRNAYGRQNESFIATIRASLNGDGGEDAPTTEAVFIRAPRIVGQSAEVRVLAEHEGHPVAVRYGRHMATTFHPELSAESPYHRYFLNLCVENQAATEKQP